MTEESAPPSRRAEAQAEAKQRRRREFERREAVFDLFISGFSHQQIAKALSTSTSTVRRIVDAALADRRLDAPERFARVQVARLTKALSHADLKLEQGDTKAFAPFLKILAALDRYHGLEGRLVTFQATERGAALPALPLALPPALPAEQPAEDDLGR